MEKLYYACSYPLGNGSIILPGNWGRVIELESNQHEEYVIKEKAIEVLRKFNFPHRPSRLNCVFLCDTLPGLEQFLFMNPRRKFEIKYEVMLENSELGSFKTDWNLISKMNVKDTISFNTLVFDYWRGENAINVEILTLSPIRIIKMIL